MARAAVLTHQQNGLLRQLGEEWYEAEAAGGELAELARPIQNARARLATLEEEVAVLSQGDQRTIWTPRRILWTTAALLLLGVAGFLWRHTAGSMLPAWLARSTPPLVHDAQSAMKAPVHESAVRPIAVSAKSRAATLVASSPSRKPPEAETSGLAAGAEPAKPKAVRDPEVAQMIQSLHETTPSEYDVKMQQCMLADVYQYLQPAFEQDDWRTKSGTIFSLGVDRLGELGPDAAVAAPLIAKILREVRDPTVRFNAAWALGEIGEDQPPIIEALTSAIGDKKSPLVQTQAALTLCRLGVLTPEVGPPLIEALRNNFEFNFKTSRNREEDYREALTRLGQKFPEVVTLVAQCFPGPPNPFALDGRRTIDSGRSLGVVWPGGSAGSA